MQRNQNLRDATLTGTPRYGIFVSLLDISKPISNKLTAVSISHKRYKSQTRTDIRESAWITIPYCDVFSTPFASLALFVPHNPQALRRKPGDWHDAKKKKDKDWDKHGISGISFFNTAAD